MDREAKQNLKIKIYAKISIEKNGVAKLCRTGTAQNVTYRV